MVILAGNGEKHCEMQPSEVEISLFF